MQPQQMEPPGEWFHSFGPVEEGALYAEISRQRPGREVAQDSYLCRQGHLSSGVGGLRPATGRQAAKNRSEHQAALSGRSVGRIGAGRSVSPVR